jgi:hypothetical protein
LNPSDTSCSFGQDVDGFGVQHFGTGCIGGELSHLFVVDLCHKAGEALLYTQGDTAEQITNQALFTNLHSGSFWSSTPYAPDADFAWAFGYRGNQYNQDTRAGFSAIAVRNGDVATVPEPQTAWLVILALGVALGDRARRSRPGKLALAA